MTKQHVGTTEFNGTHVTLVYTCEHERYENEVSFTVFSGVGDDSYTIIRQNFNSIGFLIE